MCVFEVLTFVVDVRRCNVDVLTCAYFVNTLDSMFALGMLNLYMSMAVVVLAAKALAFCGFLKRVSVFVVLFPDMLEFDVRGLKLIPMPLEDTCSVTP